MLDGLRSSFMFPSKDSHKEVERRRREIINAGISELALIVPNCTERKKGDILNRTVQYIAQLKEAEARNAERWAVDKVLADQAISELTAVIEAIKAENESLKAQIIAMGGTPLKVTNLSFQNMMDFYSRPLDSVREIEEHLNEFDQSKLAAAS